VVDETGVHGENHRISMRQMLVLFNNNMTGVDHLEGHEFTTGF
jgi:hypothetical protein